MSFSRRRCSYLFVHAGVSMPMTWNAEAVGDISFNASVSNRTAAEPTHHKIRCSKVSDVRRALCGLAADVHDWGPWLVQNQSDIASVMGGVFVSLMFPGIVSFILVIPVQEAERAVYYREKAVKTYNALAYFVATGVSELPFLVAGAVLFSCASQTRCLSWVRFAQACRPFHPQGRDLLIAFVSAVELHWHWRASRAIDEASRSDLPYLHPREL